jgi:hypothetical protein
MYDRSGDFRTATVIPLWGRFRASWIRGDLPPLASAFREAILQTTKNITLLDRGSVFDLGCPRCGGEYLHHTGALFFERGEDQPSVVKIEVAGATTTTSIDSGAGNPSSRRHGMSIKFDCEACSTPGDTLHLNIAQHKGSTELSWTFSPRVLPL